MKLPSTREEFTHFALEYSNQKLFWREYSKTMRPYALLEKWIQETFAKFPDIVEHEITPNGDVCIVIANVHIITLGLCSEEMRSCAVRHYYNKCGEFL